MQTDFLTRFQETGNSLEEYKAAGGLQGYQKAMNLEPEGILQEIQTSGLRGRGGAGFPAGTKWAAAAGKKPFLVCNGDEGEPGTFKDRFLLTRSPLLVLEGLMITAYALGAEEAWIYIRGEYSEIIENWRLLLDRVSKAGVFIRLDGRAQEVKIHLIKGGGSYVVGDETALINSIMENRGNPLFKPPYPAESGLWGQPTIVHNVETLACVPVILAGGVSRFRNIGTLETPGTKLFSVSGRVARPGIYEFPFGVRLNEVLEAAGGVLGTLKAVQIGGMAGGFFGPEALNLHLDDSFLRRAGGVLGSGALVVMNTEISAAEVLEILLRFYAEESCGKCLPCRLGMRQLDRLGRKIASGEAVGGDLDKIVEASRMVSSAAFCPFGRSIDLPVRSFMRVYRNELEMALDEFRSLQREASHV